MKNSISNYNKLDVGTNFTEEMEVVKQQYETRTMETLRAVKTAMAFAPRQLWRCDARSHKLGTTFACNMCNKYN